MPQTSTRRPRTRLRDAMWLAAVASCGGAAPPPSPPPTAPAPFAVRPAGSGQTAVLDLRPREASPPRRADALPALGVRVTVIEARAPFVSISQGASPEEPWLLGAGGHVVAADLRGRALRDRTTICPRLQDVRWSAMRHSASLDVAVGVKTMGEVEFRLVMARRTKGRAWSCDIGPNETRGFLDAAVALLPDTIWLAPAFAEAYVPETGRIQSLDGRDPPRLAGLGRAATLHVESRDRAWIVAETGSKDHPEQHLYELRGPSWSPRSHPGFATSALWEDERGTLWAAGEGAGFFRDGVWTVIPTPEGFSAGRVTGTGANDVWFVGKASIAHWDGIALRGATAPIAVFDALATRPGALWIAGRSGPELEDGGGAGAAVWIEITAEGRPR